MTENICPPDHRHEGNCYATHMCRCDRCRAHKAGLKRRQRKLVAYGRYERFVDAEPVRKHVMDLRRYGIGVPRIAELAGIDESVLNRLLYGRGRRNGNPTPPSRTVSPAHARALLAVEPTIENRAMNAGGLDSTGAHRRIQALVARGWSFEKIAQRLGITGSAISDTLRRKTISRALHERIAALYEDMWDQEPPRQDRGQKVAYTRAIRFARQRDWAPPAAWDDIDNDPTPPVPGRDDEVDEIAVELVIEGEPGIRLNRAERHLVVKHFHALYWSDGRIADLVGVRTETIARDRDDLGLEAFDQSELVRREAA